jgi:hypothetical protein
MKRISLATAVAILAVVGPAEALTQDATFRGSTTQGYHSFVKVRDGRVQSVNVPWRATNCKPATNYKIEFPRYVYIDAKSDPIKRNGIWFRDSGRDTVGIGEDGKEGKALVVSRMKGHFEGNRVVGYQRISVRTNDRYGRHSCKAFMRFSGKIVR